MPANNNPMPTTNSPLNPTASQYKIIIKNEIICFATKLAIRLKQSKQLEQSTKTPIIFVELLNVLYQCNIEEKFIKALLFEFGVALS